jgi:hypothetical protein
MNSQRFIHAAILTSLIFALFTVRINGQSTSYTQFWNEVDLVRAIGDKWAAEIDLTSSFSNTPTENNVLKTNIQRSVLGWVHYYPSSRWKLSSFAAYYYNNDVPEIGQYKAPEWRFALQGTYFFHRSGYTLNTDMRGELRLIENEEGVFEDVYRYRQKLKFLLPLNSHVLRQGVVYVLASEEIIFRSVFKSEGVHYFDSNLFTVGGGYLFLDDLQLELVYVNVFSPRDDGNIITNAVSLTLTVNNLISKIGKVFKGKEAKPAGDE